MRIEIAKVFDVLVVRLDGDFVNEVALEKRILGHVSKETPKVLINFDKVDYINSNCFRSLARVYHKVLAIDGDVRLCSLKQNVRHLFQLASIDRGFPIYCCEDEGVISFYSNFEHTNDFRSEIAYSS